MDGFIKRIYISAVLFVRLFVKRTVKIQNPQRELAYFPRNPLLSDAIKRTCRPFDTDSGLHALKKTPGPRQLYEEDVCA